MSGSTLSAEVNRLFVGDLHVFINAKTTHVCVFDNSLTSAGDSALTKIPTKYVAIGDDAYRIAEYGASFEECEFLYNISDSWLRTIFLIDDRDLLVAAHLREKLYSSALPRLLSGLAGAVVSAYDGESNVFARCD